MKTSPTLSLWWWWWLLLWWCSGGGVVVTVSSVTTYGGQETLPLISEEESRLIIRRKLHETASSFEMNLRNQLSGVEYDVYAEFRTILEGLGDMQDTLTQEISTKLRQERSEVLRKMNKVATYSAILTENLYRELRKILKELGVWTEEPADDASVLFNLQPELLPEIHGFSSSSSTSANASYGSSSSSSTSANASYRSKRQMLAWDLDSDDHKNLALYEPFNEEDMEEVLASFEHMNSHVRPQGDLDKAHTAWMTSGIAEIPDSPQGQSRKLPKDCLDLLEYGFTQDGVYTIYPTGLGVRAWCDMSNVGGGWTVVVGRRGSQPQVNFSRPLLHYQFGFGDPKTQHWLGLDHIHALTHETNSSMRLHIQHHGLTTPLYATYHTFSVGSREEGSRLTVGDYDHTSIAEDALSPHNDAVFISPESGISDNPCVEELNVGWWFLEAPLCYLALPTGQMSSQECPKGMRGSLAWLGTEQSPETLLLMVRRDGNAD